jgi:broad specificity phosphatase PhoE
MKNTLIFIRHAKTKVDKNVPIENWVLTEDGEKEAVKLADNEKLLDADILISSSEKKAYLTIKPLSDKLNKKIIQISELGEIQRPNSERLTFEDYENMKTKIFEDLDYTEYGWETANHALERFKKAVEEIDKKQVDKKIIICAHGTVLTLYFAYLKKEMNKLFLRWKRMEFGKYGIIKNGEIIEDIIKNGVNKI